MRHRATPRFWACYESGTDLVWVWIGSHSEHDRLLEGV